MPIRAAILDGDSVVSNIVLLNSLDEFSGAVPAGDGAIGDRYQDGQFIKLNPTVPAVPLSVTRAQGKAALIQAGLWPQVLAYVDGIKDPAEKALAEVALNDTTEWLRTSPFLAAVADALGLSGERLDDLFRTGATIEL